MKFKVLKDFSSSVLNGIKDKIHDLELDEPTAKMWTEHGLIEEVKENATPEVDATADETDQEVASGSPENSPVANLAPTAASDPAAVITDEN